MKQLLTIAFFAITAFSLYGQGLSIRLANPSFEGESGPGILPPGWFDCGFEQETPPDLHPNALTDLGLLPQDGNTFMGMVVRDNASWEGVGQKLLTPLIKDQCYTLSFYAARSETLVSISRVTGEIANYNVPAVLQIWGGYDECEQRELLGESFPIESTGWERYDFVLYPSDTLEYISIEAYYQSGYTEAYNGNILLDNFSDIQWVPCDTALAQLTEDYSSDSVAINFSKATPLQASNIGQLEEVILENAANIRFETDNSLQSTFFYDKNDELISQNRAIYNIGVAAAALPDVQLTFALFAYSNVGFEKRRQAVLSGLEKTGVTAERISVLSQDSVSTTQNWLWKTESAEAWVSIGQ